MFQNAKQPSQPLVTPHKIPKNKPSATPNSKHKDRLTIQQSYKKRESMRRSFHRRIAWLQIICIPKPRKTLNARKSDNQQSIDYELAKRLQATSIKMNKNDQHIKQLTQKIISIQEVMSEMKKVKQKARDMYFQQKQITRVAKFQYSEKQQQCYRIRNETNNIHFDTKRQIFEMASRQFDITKQINHNQQLALKKQEKLQQIFQQFREKTELVATNELKIEDLKKQVQITKQNLKAISLTYNLEFSQLFILKFQINCNLVIGMQTSANGLQKKVMLDKDYKSWDRTKQKRLQFVDMKRWIVLQLYRGWKNILRKLSYQSSQYQILFGQTTNYPILQDLKRFLSQDKIRASNRKFQKSLIFYSELKNPYSYKQQIKSQLKQFNNGLISIKSIQFVENQGNTQLEIHYIYLQNQQLVEKFGYQEYNVVNKDKILKDLKNSERRIFCLIEIPLAAHKDDILRYEEVYDIVKKKRTNLGTVTRSLSK